jgi:hypothetical protein
MHNLESKQTNATKGHDAMISAEEMQLYDKENDSPSNCANQQHQSKNQKIKKSMASNALSHQCQIQNYMPMQIQLQQQIEHQLNIKKL